MAEICQHMFHAAVSHQPPDVRPSGGYRVFQVHYKSSNLSVLLLAIAAHPSGDLMGAMEFPSLQSYTFHCGCCASVVTSHVGEALLVYSQRDSKL
ncbi:hypothetical protein KUCAC02_017496 [Chaenocephalus aceratus]|uniref:Uncharacterized protein n=1 Tax=Chaenocephalus aceratus TaxID=36190 RepID=A0ACB9W2B1_CHAAC|nr:hypothetical protein KUCAC02_017496 [Chaenocephalus aceratus]